jgi:glucosyl-dolichyl phosphate glucuronosyltransferase
MSVSESAPAGRAMARPSIDISVILCTYNRSARLRTALKSLLACDRTGIAAWELIVVDNNSTDGTHAVVEEFRRADPHTVRSLFCAELGKSHALNAGIAAARGELLVFTDDDLTFAPQWLRSYAEAMRTGATGYAGRVVAVWDSPRPRWLSEDGPHRLMDVIVQYDLGEAVLTVPPTRPPFGANMAFRRTAFTRHGPMRTDLGRVGRTSLTGEDTEFGRRVMGARERIEYIPSATAYHPVDQFRLQRRFFLDYYYQFGRSHARLQRPPRDCVRLFGVPRYMIRSLAIDFALWLTAFGTKRRFYYKLATYRACGKLVEEYRLHRAADSAP